MSIIRLEIAGFGPVECETVEDAIQLIDRYRTTPPSGQAAAQGQETPRLEPIAAPGSSKTESVAKAPGRNINRGGSDYERFLGELRMERYKKAFELILQAGSAGIDASKLIQELGLSTKAGGSLSAGLQHAAKRAGLVDVAIIREKQGNRSVVFRTLLTKPEPEDEDEQTATIEQGVAARQS